MCLHVCLRTIRFKLDSMELRPDLNSDFSAQLHKCCEGHRYATIPGQKAHLMILLMMYIGYHPLPPQKQLKEQFFVFHSVKAGVGGGLSHCAECQEAERNTNTQLTFFFLFSLRPQSMVWCDPTFHQTVLFKYKPFTVCQLYLNKIVTEL